MTHRAMLPQGVLADAAPGAVLGLPKDVAHRFTRVLRLAPGAAVVLLDGQGRVVHGTLAGDAVQVDRVEDTPAPDAPLVVLQAVVRMAKLEQVAQRATEAGADHITLFDAARGNVKLGDKAAKKRERLVRIAQDATRQSLRARGPRVDGPIAFTALLDQVRAFEGVVVLGVLGAHPPLSAVLRDTDAFARGMAVVIGPEGGLAPDEIDALTRAGAVPCRMGRHVMRTETAAVAALTIAQVAGGDA